VFIFVLLFDRSKGHSSIESLTQYESPLKASVRYIEEIGIKRSHLAIIRQGDGALNLEGFRNHFGQNVWVLTFTSAMERGPIHRNPPQEMKQKNLAPTQSRLQYERERVLNTRGQVRVYLLWCPRSFFSLIQKAFELPPEVAGIHLVDLPNITESSLSDALAAEPENSNVRVILFMDSNELFESRYTELQKIGNFVKQKGLPQTVVLADDHKTSKEIICDMTAQIANLLPESSCKIILNDASEDNLIQIMRLFGSIKLDGQKYLLQQVFVAQGPLAGRTNQVIE